MLLDVSGYNRRRSFFPGFFSRDAITLAAYKYYNINSRVLYGNKYNLAIINRKNKRRFINGTKWIDIIKIAHNVF